MTFSKAITSVIAVAILLALSLVFAADRDESDARDVLAPEERQWLAEHDGLVRIGITEIPPQVLCGEKAGDYKGLSIDYIRLVEHNLKCRFQFVYYSTWNDVLQAARDRGIDMIFAAQITPERSEYLLYSAPYIEMPNMIIVRKNLQGEFTLEKMKGMKIVCSQGSAVHEFLKANYGYLDIRPVKDEMSGLMQVSFGEANAMVVELSRASYLIEKANITNLRVAGSSGYKYELRFASRKDWPVLNRILDKGLAAISTSDRDAITRKWVFENDGSVFASRRFWFICVAGVSTIMLVFFGVVFWNRVLKAQVGQHTSRLQQELMERRQAEEALRRQSEFLETLLETIPNPIFYKGADGKYIGCNRAFEEFWGLSRHEIIGKTVYDMGPREIADRYALEDRVLADHLGRQHYEWVVRRKDGQMRDVIFDKAAILERTGRFDGLIGVISDITERKRAEQEREQLQSQLNQIQKLEAVGRLAGGVAHDFNNMLGVILGHADLVLSEIRPDAPIYHDVLQMRNAAERSADLTRQLLAFARKQTINPKVLDLGETVAGILNMLRRLIGEDVNLVWKPGTHVWPVKMDPSQIDQILANLVVNARDAMTGVGRLTVEIANMVFDDICCTTHKEFKPGSYVMLAVSDTGSGMDKETLSRIFEPFFTTRELGKGTGLGLATVYGIVRQNNGFINVYSEQGHGTIFKIYLPRAEERVAGQVAVKREKNLGGTETVLLVEDEEPILALGRTILERYGYAVLAARGPAEALQMAQSHAGPIHLLITDVIMPEMNGKNLEEKLAEVKPGFKCIFISGYTADVIAHHGVLNQAIEFLQKPFSVRSLLEKVRNVLDDTGK